MASGLACRGWERCVGLARKMLPSWVSKKIQLSFKKNPVGLQCTPSNHTARPPEEGGAPAVYPTGQNINGSKLTSWVVTRVVLRARESERYFRPKGVFLVLSLCPTHLTQNVKHPNVPHRHFQRGSVRKRPLTRPFLTHNSKKKLEVSEKIAIFVPASRWKGEHSVG